MVVQNGGGWAFDTAPGAAPGGYITSNGSGGYRIDTTAGSGLTLRARGGRPYIEG